MLDPVVGWILRLALALLFGAAAWHKLRDLSRFTATLRAYALLPAALTKPAALAVPFAELFAGVALFAAPLTPVGAIPVLIPIGPAAALAMLVLYSAAIGANLARGRRDVACGCFGPAGREPLLSPRLLARNALFAIGPCALLLGVAPRALSLVDAVSVIGGVAVVALVFLALEQLQGLRRVAA